MYARKVTMKLKPNKSADFTKRLEADVIPLLRKQKGFQDEIAFAANGGREAFGISLWDRKESAELENVIDGEAHVHGYEVSTSTFHKILATEEK
jgi:hypothetical protein